MKEQETVGLMGALLLSMAATTLFEVPDVVKNITGAYHPSEGKVPSKLRDLYLLCCCLAYASEALAVCISVLIILMLNSQQTHNKYIDLCDFLRSFWPFCGLTPIMVALGLVAMSSTVLLYTIAGFWDGLFTVVVPVLCGLGCCASYVLGSSILLKVLLRALLGKPTDSTGGGGDAVRCVVTAAHLSDEVKKS
jgi:hypothetical protein